MGAAKEELIRLLEQEALEERVVPCDCEARSKGERL